MMNKKNNAWNEGINPAKESEREECLEKYHKSMSRKNIFPRVRQVYKMHK